MHIVWPLLQQGCGHMAPLCPEFEPVAGTWRSSLMSAAVPMGQVPYVCGSDAQLSILTESAMLGFRAPFLLQSPALFLGPPGDHGSSPKSFYPFEKAPFLLAGFAQWL